MADTQTTYQGTAARALAQFVQRRRKEWGKNREKLEEKWERNRKDVQQLCRKEWKRGEGQDWRSNTISGQARRKFTSAVAIVLDQLLQGNQVPFALKPSEDQAEMLLNAPDAIRDSVQKDARSMRRKIHQQYDDCNADREFAKNIFAGGCYGETYALGAVREIVRKRRRIKQYPGIEDTSRLPREFQQWETYEERYMSPTWEYISVWAIYRDLEESITNGAGFIIEAMKSPYWLRNKRSRPYYIDAGINNSIKEAGEKQAAGQPAPGVNKDVLPPQIRELEYRMNNIQYLEFRGRAPRKLVEAYEDEVKITPDQPSTSTTGPGPANDGTENDGDEIECIICVNKENLCRFIRTSTDERLLFHCKWEENIDELAGRGIPDNTEASHDVMTGALRAFEDTTYLSSVLILALKERLLENPEDINEGLMKGVLKLLVSEDCEDARQAVQQLTIQPPNAAIKDLLTIFEAYGDEDSMVPPIQTGGEERSNITAFEVSTRVEKAGKYIGGVIRNYDEYLIEPITTYFYNYNMDDPDFTEGKGDFTVVPLGFSSYQNRTERIRKLQIVMELMFAHPELARRYKMDEFTDEIVKALDIDAENFQKTEAELEAEAQQAATTPPDPAAAAEVNRLTAETDKLTADAESKRTKSQIDLNKIQDDLDAEEAALDLQLEGAR